MKKTPCQPEVFYVSWLIGWTRVTQEFTTSTAAQFFAFHLVLKGYRGVWYSYEGKEAQNG
jgi:hypothetical protein